eukprot:8237272-Pyramimonas_sp.AAC.2
MCELEWFPFRSELWIVDDGTVTKYHSDFEDFRDELIKEIQAEQEQDDKEEMEGSNRPPPVRD